MLFRSVIQFDLQPSHTRVTRAALLPPTIQGVCNKVARLSGCTQREPQLVYLCLTTSDFQNAERNEQRLVAHIVIEGFRRFSPATGTTSTERTNLYFRFGIKRNPQAVVVLTCGFATSMNIGEDVVCLGNFFLGTVFTTRRSR